jgi:glycine cleavage system H lipoate-binding protein
LTFFISAKIKNIFNQCSDTVSKLHWEDAMTRESINYMGTHWLQIEDSIVTVGLNEDSLDDVDDIETINLPSEGETFEADEICGEL